MISHVTLTLLLVVLIANLIVALGRVILGPTSRDRLTGILFAGTTGAACLAIASVTLDVPALRDVAATIVALAAVIVVVRVRTERVGEANAPIGAVDAVGDAADAGDEVSS